MKNQRKITIIIMIFLSLCYTIYTIVLYLNKEGNFVSIISGILFIATFSVSLFNAKE